MSLAILAGGRGKRLGGAVKGLLEVEGRPIVTRLLELRALAADAFLVANDPAPYAGFGVPIVPDAVQGKGAPGGLHAALSHARTPWVLLVACDMPFVVPAVAQALLAARTPDVEWVCADLGGLLEPMPGVYASRWREAVGAALPGDPSLRGLLRGAVGRAVPAEDLRAVDPDLRTFVSINAPEDAARWGVRLPSVGR